MDGLSYGWGMDMPRPWTTTVLTHLGQPCGLPTLPTAAWTTPAGLPTCPHPLLRLGATRLPEPRTIGAFAPPLSLTPAVFALTEMPVRFQPNSVFGMIRNECTD